MPLLVPQREPNDNLFDFLALVDDGAGGTILANQPADTTHTISIVSRAWSFAAAHPSRSTERRALE